MVSYPSKTYTKQATALSTCPLQHWLLLSSRDNPLFWDARVPVPLLRCSEQDCSSPTQICKYICIKNYKSKNALLNPLLHSTKPKFFHNESPQMGVGLVSRVCQAQPSWGERHEIEREVALLGLTIFLSCPEGNALRAAIAEGDAVFGTWGISRFNILGCAGVAPRHKPQPSTASTLSLPCTAPSRAAPSRETKLN